MSSLDTSAQLAGDTSLFRPEIGPEFNQSLDRLYGLANQENESSRILRPIVEASQGDFGIGSDQLRRTAEGGLLTGNPYLEEIIRNQTDRLTNDINSQFSAAGRYGSGAHTGVLTDRLGELSSRLRFDNYNTERARQLQASQLLYGQGLQGAQLSSLLDQNDLADANLGLQVGGIRNQIADANKQAPLRANEWLNAQSIPIAALGGTEEGTSTTTKKANPFQTALGLGVAALGAFSGNPQLAASGLQGANASYAIDPTVAPSFSAPGGGISLDQVRPTSFAPPTGALFGPTGTTAGGAGNPGLLGYGANRWPGT